MEAKEPEVKVSVIEIVEAQPAETHWTDGLSDFVEIPELELPKLSDFVELPALKLPELPEVLNIPESIDLSEILTIPENFEVSDILKIPESLQLTEFLNIPESFQLPEIQLPEVNLPFLPTFELPSLQLPEVQLSEVFQLPTLELPKIPLLEDINFSELRLSQLQLPEFPGLPELPGLPQLPPGWRPMKVVSMLGAMMIVVLMVLSVIPPEWLVIFGWQGKLVSICVPEYTQIADALYMVFMITDIFATVFTCIELQVEDEDTKNRYHMQSVAVGTVSVSSLVTWLTMFPVCFTQESDAESAVEWKYVGAWTAAVGLFTAVLSPDEDENNEGDGGDECGLDEEFNEDDVGVDDEMNGDDLEVDDEIDEDEADIDDDEPDNDEETQKEEKKEKEKKEEKKQEKDKEEKEEKSDGKENKKKQKSVDKEDKDKSDDAKQDKRAASDLTTSTKVAGVEPEVIDGRDGVADENVEVP